MYIYFVRLFQYIIDRIFGGVTFEEYLKSLDYVDYSNKYLFLEHKKLIDLKVLKSLKI